MNIMHRRKVLAGALGVVGSAACQRQQVPRCGHCGMKVDMTSPWRVEWQSQAKETKVYDAPKCALAQWVKGTLGGGILRFQEYYDRAWARGDELVFVKGSDVIGPMGADLVPVSPGYASKFMKDHAGTEALPFGAITEQVLASLA